MDFTYRTTADGIVITGYTGSGGSVVIPESISGKTVVGFYTSVFSNNSKILNISIPNGVANIGEKAFSFCTELTSVSFGTGIQSIEKSSFENCYKLSSVVLPDSVTEIGDLAFNNCSGLVSANLGNGIEDDGLGYGIFYGCTKLETVTIPNSITTIQKYMFYGCSKLSVFPVGNSITTIEDYAFRRCSSLLNVVIPDSVTSLGKYSFAECKKMTDITFGTGITEIPENVCSWCDKLVNITIPSTAVTIGQAAFAWCIGLQYLSFPDSVTTLASEVCRDCSSLTEVVIGDGIPEITAFDFYKCSNLSKITLGVNVELISDNSFYSCNNLTNLTFKGDAPEVTIYDGSNALKDVPGPAYYYEGTSGWEPVWFGLQTICLDCQYSSSSSSSSSMGSSGGSSFSSSESSLWSSQSLNNSSTSESSEIQARTLPFSIRGISWKSSGKINGHLSAISYPSSYENRVSQTSKILLDRYQIDRVALYLGEKRGTSSAYTLWIDIYESDSYGKPLTLLESISKDASEFSSEGWYFFDTSSTERLSPPEEMISIVFRQEGGDDLNCVPWYYSKDSSAGISNKNICYISSDSILWEEVPGISMTMKLINSVDMFSEAYFDTPPHRINTAEGDPATMVLDSEEYLASGIIESGSRNVKLVPNEQEDTSGTSGSDDNEDSLKRPYIEIDPPKIITSLVLDGSGSMGWNDRRFGRLEIAREIANLLINDYPGEALIDIIRMGAIQVQGLDFEPSKDYGSIKIDLHNPESTLKNADGTDPSLFDGIVAYGLSDLEKGNTYVISRIFMDDVDIEDGNGITYQDLQIKIPLNVSSFGDSSQDALFQIAEEGPGSESGIGSDAIVAELQGDVNHIRRNVQVKRHLFVANLTQEAEVGDLSVEVDSSTNFFELQNISIIDASGTDPGKTISSVDDETISISEELLLDFGLKDSSLGGFIQEGIIGKSFDLSSGTTLELLVKDANVSRTVTFYLETEKGGRLEWSILPFKEWSPLLLFYSDKGGKISIKGFDNENQPLPDGTEVQFYVDDKNPDFEVAVNEPILIDILNPPLAEGSDTIFVESLGGIKAGDSVTLLGEDPENENITGFLVESVNEENMSLTIFPPYDTSSFQIVSIEVTQPDIAEEDEKQKVFLPISVVDLTPSKLNRDADPLALANYDPPPTSSSTTNPDSYNQSPDYEVRLPMDFPSMWDATEKSSFVALRILPITDDVVDTEDQKDKKVIAATKQSLSDKEKALIESLEDDYRIEMENAGLATTDEIALDNEPFSISVQKTPEDVDYSIQTPVLLFGGQADSFMQTFTTEMEMFDETTMGSHTESYKMYSGSENWEQSGLLAKKYTLYPYVILKDNYGSAIAIKEVDSFEIFFASPYQIWSNIGPSDKKVDFKCVFQAPDALPGEASETEGSVEIPGCYAATDEVLFIDYVVTYKGSLIKDGNLLVKIFDGNRDSDLMKEPESNVPDFSAELCSADSDGVPTFKLEDVRNSIYSRRPRGTSGTYLDEVEYQQASYIEGYSETVTVPIVNGRARIEIKAPGSVVAKIITMAEFVFPEDQNQSVTKQDPIWFVNPLELTYQGSHRFQSGHTQPLYEIGATVRFKGVAVEDNVPVEFFTNSHSRFLPGQGNVISRDDPSAQGITNFIDGVSGLEGLTGGALSSGIAAIEDSFAKYGNWPPTPISPSVSKTINGVARGVYLGTHGDVVNHFDTETLEQKGDEEKLIIKTTYLGFSLSLTEKIEWMGIDENNDFKFRLKLYDESGRELTGFAAEVYADGWKAVYVLADLAASVTMYPSCDPYIDILLGRDAYGNPVGSGEPSKVLFMGAGDGVWQENQPLLGGRQIGSDITLDGDAGRGYCLSKPISLASVVNKEKCDCTYMGACFPQGTLIDAWTSAKVGTQKFNGMGCMCERDWNNDCENLVPCGDGFKTVPTRPATILWAEPLVGKITSFGKELFLVNRDGNVTEVIVDLTFSGEAIPIVAERNNATDASGNRPIIPTVSFDLYKIVEEKDPNGNVIRTTEVRDDSLSLKNYSSPCVIELTDSHYSASEPHFHKCQVDNSGNGTTTLEYEDETGNEIPPTHTHIISSYVISEVINGFGESHSHRVRSVAKTTINPTNDIVNQICLVAKFSYDASKTPIERTISVKGCDSADSSQNGWSLTLKATPEYVVQESTTVSDSGMDLIAELSHTVDGELVQIPEGTRIHFDVDVYLQDDSEVPGTTRRTVVFTADDSRPFVVLNWKASITVGDGEIVEAEAKTKVSSSFSWLPNVRALVPELTSDSIFIDKALSSITTLGASPLHDATYLAASRVISHKNENQNWNNAFSCMALITDGDENLSDKVLDQGIQAIKRTSSNVDSNAVSIALGRPHPSDLLVLKKYAEETNGIVIKVSEKTVNGQDIAKKAFSEKLQEANSGIYRNVVDLSSKKLFKTALIDSYLPSGSSMLFRARFGDDGKNWEVWSEKIDITSSGEVDVQNLSGNSPYRFMEYEVVLIGNTDFDSPRFLSISISYIEPKKHTILFAPITVDISPEEYIGEVLITHKVSDSVNSTISYGVVQANSLEEAEYFSNSQPLFGTATRQILLGRHNELATSVDRSKFWLVNGPWPSSTDIEVYKIIGETTEYAPPSSYSANPREGSISFSTIQSDETKLSVSIKYPSLIRIICLITNYGEEAITIDHIGVTYNTVQRIEMDEFGIIRTPISDVYEMSSSSSESSEINGLNTE